MKKHPKCLLPLIFSIFLLSISFYSTVSSTPELNQIQDLLTTIKAKLVKLLTGISSLTNPVITEPEPELTEEEKKELNKLETEVNNILPNLDKKTPTEIEELIKKLEKISHENIIKQFESASLETQVEKVRQAELKMLPKQPIVKIVTPHSVSGDVTAGIKKQRGGMASDPEALELCTLIKTNISHNTLSEYFQSLKQDQLNQIDEIIKNEELEDEDDKDTGLSEAFLAGGFTLPTLKAAYDKETKIRESIKPLKSPTIENVKKAQQTTYEDLKKIQKESQLDNHFFTFILPNIWTKNFELWLNPATHNHNPACEEITKFLATQTNISKIMTTMGEKEHALALIQEILKADQKIKKREIQEREQFQELLQDKAIDSSTLPLFSNIATTESNYRLKEGYWKNALPQEAAKNQLNAITPQLIQKPWQPNQKFFDNLPTLWAVDFNEWIASLMTTINGQKLIKNLASKENRIKICTTLQANQPKALAIIYRILFTDREIETMRRKIEAQNKQTLTNILANAFLAKTLGDEINATIEEKKYLYAYFRNKLIYGNKQFWTDCLSQLKEHPNPNTVDALKNIYNFIQQIIQNYPIKNPATITKINQQVLAALNEKNKSTTTTQFKNFVTPTPPHKKTK